MDRDIFDELDQLGRGALGSGAQRSQTRRPQYDASPAYTPYNGHVQDQGHPLQHEYGVAEQYHDEPHRLDGFGECFRDEETSEQALTLVKMSSCSKSRTTIAVMVRLSLVMRDSPYALQALRDTRRFPELLPYIKLRQLHDAWICLSSLWDLDNLALRPPRYVPNSSHLVLLSVRVRDGQRAMIPRLKLLVISPIISRRDAFPYPVSKVNSYHRCRPLQLRT